MSPVNLEVSTWLMWVGAGIVVSLVSAGFYGGRRMLGYDLFVGVVCALLGGWCSAYIAGENIPQLAIVSVLCAVLLAVVGVWLLNRYSMRSTRNRKH